MKSVFKSFFTVCLLLMCAIAAFMPQYAKASKVSMNDVDKKITIYYDDRYSFSENVKQITTISANSTNVVSGKKDKIVLELADDDEDTKNKVVATGCGKAVVELENGKKIGVKVKPAKISLLLLIGQSNMEGSPNKKGNLYDYQQEYVINKQGSVYSTYGPSTLSHSLTNGCFKTKSPKLTIWNTKEFVPETLTDNSSNNEWKRTNNLTYDANATGKTGIDGALAKEWVKKTKEKVWLVNAAHSGSSIETWLPGKEKTNNNFWQAVMLYRTCERVLNNEIEAGHYKLSHKGYFWLQGETDSNMLASTYIKKYMKLHEGLKKELAGNRGSKFKNTKKDLEFAGILMVRAHGKPYNNSDLYMTGPRKAQYYMCNSSFDKYSDIYLASHIAEDWVTDEGVEEYFNSKYPSYEEYVKFNTMKKPFTQIPSTVAEVHETVHYTQLGYNELGRDAADNICYALGYAEPPKEEATIKIVGSDGYTDVSSSVSTSSEAMSLTIKISPAYKTKKLKVMRTDGISLNRWNVKFRPDNYFSGKVKFIVGNKNKVYTLWSQNGISSIQNLTKVPEGVKIDWKKLNKASYYKVFRRKNGTEKWSCIRKANKNEISYTDTETMLGTDYEYMVCAYDKYGIKGKNAILNILA